MDVLSEKVETSRRDLRGSRAKLAELEARIRESIPPKIEEMQTAVSYGRHQVQYVLSQLQDSDVSRSVERSTEQPHGDLDLHPQMQWLNQHLGVLSEKLKTANKAATEALERTVNYVVGVTDVGQKIKLIQIDLEDTQSLLRELACVAQSHLLSVQQDLAATEARIRALQSEIRQKRFEVAGKRVKLLLPRFSKAIKQYQTTSTKDRARAKRLKAFANFRTGLKGILLAPPTLGLSLIVSVASAGSVVSNLIQWRRLSSEAEEMQSAGDQLESEIASALETIEALQHQKGLLEKTLEEHRSALLSKASERDACENQISSGRALQAETGRLETLAVKAGKDGAQVCRTLDRWKNVLEECDAGLHKELVEAKGHSRSLEREMRRRETVGPTRQDFARQCDVLRCVMAALDRVRTDDRALQILWTGIEYSGVEKSRGDRRPVLGM